MTKQRSTHTHTSSTMTSLTEWTSLPPMSTKRTVCAAAAMGECLYIVGGRDDNRKLLSTAEVFNVESRKWTSLPPMCKIRGGCAAVAIKDCLYVVGGNCNSAEVFNVQTKRWTLLPNMSVDRWGCAAAAMGDFLYVVGGYSGGKSLSLAEVYNVKFRTWTSLPPMTTERRYCAAAAVGECVYVVGGRHDNENNLSSAEVYNTQTRRWTSLPPMSTEHWECAATVLGDCVYVVGGEDGNDDKLSSAEVYNTQTGEWTSLPPMSIKRSGCAAAAVGDCLYIVGGRDDIGNFLSSAETIQVARPGPSPFYEKLMEEDDRNIHFKISELIPILEDVHQLKFLYTMVNTCHRLGYLDGEECTRYIKKALERVAETMSCNESVATYKLVLEKAREDNVIDSHTMNSLDRKAEVTHTSNAPFVKDLWEHVHENTMRIHLLEARVDGIEARVEGLEGRTENIEVVVSGLHTSLVKLQKGIRYQKKVEAAVGMMGAVLNAVTFGVAGSAFAGVMGTAINNIVDFGDLTHIQAVVETFGDVTVHEAMDVALQLVQDKASDKLYSAAKEGTTILEGPAHKELLRAAKDGSPLIAIAVTAHVVSSNCNIGAATDRVRALEEQLELENVPTAILRRVKNVEIQFYGEAQQGGGSLVERVSRMEEELGLS